MKKRFTVGAVGQTKAGKTTTIAFLTNATEQIREISAGEDNRTKSTIDYHADVNYDGKLMIEEIVPNLSKICGSDDGNIDKFNENIRKNSILKSVFGLEEISNENYSDSKEYVKDVLKSFENKVLDTDKLKQMVNQEGIDDFIVRLVFKVGVNPHVKKYLSDNNIDLVIRDTRGLLDIVIEESTADIKIRRTKSLATLGLEGLDGIVFFCSQTYPNITSTIYEDMLSKLMKSIPVFLIVRDDVFKVAYKDYSSKTGDNSLLTMKHFIELLHDIDNNTNIGFYEDIEYEFYETMEFFSKFNITSLSGGKWDFNEPYFNVRKVEYTLPNCKALKTQKFVNEDAMVDTHRYDYEMLKNASIATMLCIIDELTKLHVRMNNMIKDTKGKLFETLNNLIHDNKVQARLKSDYLKFDNGRGHVTGPKCTRPVLDGMNTIKLNEDTLNNNVRLMGNRDGITSRVHGGGNLQFPLTAILGATSSNWLYELIDEVNTRGLLSPQGLNEEQVDILVKKILRYVYYRKYIDQNATIDGYLLADRYNIKEKVVEIRQNQDTKDAFLLAVTKLIEEFNNTLQKMDDIADVYIQDRHNSSI